MNNTRPPTVTPKLRFPEFVAEAIREVQLGDVTADCTDRNGTSQTHFPIMGVSKSDGIVPMEVRLIGSDIARYKRVERDCFAYNPMRLNIGSIARWKGEGKVLVSPDYVVFRCVTEGELTINPAYLDQFRCSDQWEDFVTESGDGGVRIRIYYKDLARLSLRLPSLAEQQKIADCLTSLDEWIGAQGRKVEALRAHKRGLMQQLFPREGETLPRLRFPEFKDAGAWEPRLLGEFINERSEIANSRIPLYSLTIEDGVTAKTDRYERSFLVTSKEDAYKVVLPNDFAFNPMNLRFGAIGRHKGLQPVSLSKYYNIFYCDDSVDPGFCELYFRSEQLVAYYDLMATGTLIEKRRVHFDRFLKFKPVFPSIAEQQRIAECLSSLDARIAAESEKLAALTTHKQGLMQQLFPTVEDKG